MIKLAIYGAIILALLGGAGWWYGNHVKGQAALESQQALCKTYKLKRCDEKSLAEHIAAQEDRTEQVEAANASNLDALEKVQQAVVDQAEAVAQQSARVAAVEARARALDRRIAKAEELSPAARAFLAQPVPPEVEALLDDEVVVPR